MAQFLTNDEIRELENTYAEGISSAEVVRIFREKGIRLSQATFRKYVQLGLLPRSYRVSAGSKGKHRGSRGLYPYTVIRKINDIKRMISEGLTLDDIIRAARKFAMEISGINSGLQQLFQEMNEELERPHFDVSIKPIVKEELETAKHTAKQLINTLENIDSTLTNPKPTF